jgi:hypothetical protein
MEKYYKIAGLTVRMNTFGVTEERAEKYRCEPTDTVDMQVVSNWERIKDQHPGYDANTGEYMSTAANFYKQLLDFEGMMLHSSTVVVDGRAYCFTADSGTGKSTHTGLWLRQFGERAYILNDDKPALRREDGVWYAYGTPWSGKHDISVDVRVPLAGIACLSRAAENHIEPFAGAAAIGAIFKQLNRPRNPECRIKLLELLDKLIREVPGWQLHCNMEPQAAQVAYAAMSTVGKDQIE